MAEEWEVVWEMITDVHKNVVLRPKLFFALIEKRLINFDDVEEINLAKTNMDKLGVLIGGYLSKTGPGSLDKFLEALRKDDQQYIADQISSRKRQREMLNSSTSAKPSPSEIGEDTKSMKAPSQVSLIVIPAATVHTKKATVDKKSYVTITVPSTTRVAPVKPTEENKDQATTAKTEFCHDVKDEIEEGPVARIEIAPGSLSDDCGDKQTIEIALTVQSLSSNSSISGRRERLKSEMSDASSSSGNYSQEDKEIFSPLNEEDRSLDTSHAVPIGPMVSLKSNLEVQLNKPARVTVPHADISECVLDGYSGDTPSVEVRQLSISNDSSGKKWLVVESVQQKDKSFVFLQKIPLDAVFIALAKSESLVRDWYETNIEFWIVGSPFLDQLLYPHLVCLTGGFPLDMNQLKVGKDEHYPTSWALPVKRKVPIQTAITASMTARDKHWCFDESSSSKTLLLSTDFSQQTVTFCLEHSSRQKEKAPLEKANCCCTVKLHNETVTIPFSTPEDTTLSLETKSENVPRDRDSDFRGDKYTQFCKSVLPNSSDSSTRQGLLMESA